MAVLLQWTQVTQRRESSAEKEDGESSLLSSSLPGVHGAQVSLIIHPAGTRVPLLQPRAGLTSNKCPLGAPSHGSSQPVEFSACSFAIKAAAGEKTSGQVYSWWRMTTSQMVWPQFLINTCTASCNGGNGQCSFPALCILQNSTSSKFSCKIIRKAMNHGIEKYL